MMPYKLKLSTGLEEVKQQEKGKNRKRRKEKDKKRDGMWERERGEKGSRGRKTWLSDSTNPLSSSSLAIFALF